MFAINNQTLKNRNSLLSKLAGTTWGAQVSTLRTSALALCYSVTEYCGHVWLRSSHVGLVDCQLNNAMRLISGCVWPTQIPWLPVLANIAPPALCRRSATDKLLCNIEAHPNWPLYAYVFDHPQKRLVARRPIWADTTLVDQSVQWEEDWLSAAVGNSHLVCEPTIQQPGFDLPCHSWTLLNCFCTGQGPCRANMHKWGLVSSPVPTL